MNRSLITRSGLAATMLACVVAVSGCIVSFMVTTSHVQKSIYMEMEKRSELIAMQVQTSLATICEDIAGMSANTLISNALVDNSARDRYIAPFLKNLHRTGKLTINIHLTDYRGREVAANNAGKYTPATMQLIQTSIERNQPQAFWTNSGENIDATIIWPVRYANTGLPEGALVYNFSLQDIVGDIFPPNSENSSFVISVTRKSSNTAFTVVQGQPAPSSAYTNTIQIMPPEVFNDWRITTTAWTDSASYNEERFYLGFLYAAICALTCAILIPAGLYVSRRTLRRLQNLERNTKAIIETGSLHQFFSEEGNDEIASLARAFNIMLAKLDEAQKALRRETTKEIGKHSDRLKRVLAQTTEGYLRIDAATGHILEVNDAFCRISGKKAAAWLGQPVPDYLARLTRRTTQAQATTSWPGEEVVIPGDHREQRHLLTHFNLDIDEAGTRQIMVFLTDVTPLKQIEATLRERESMLRAMSEATYDAQVMIDANDTVLFWSPAAERIFQFSRSEAMGQKMHLLITPEEYHEKAYAGLRHFATSGTGSAIGTIDEFIAIRKDGTRFPVERSVSAFQKDGEWFAVGILRDISARKEIERMKNEFISIVSHELRTPLTSIKGALGLLTGGGIQDAKQTRLLLDLASTNTERLINLINDILDLEKIESARMTYHMENIDLAQAVLAAVHDNTGLATHYNVQFSCNTGDLALPVIADSARIGQVLANLLSNGAKYSPPGGTVEISAAQHGDRARVEVRDHGPGVPASFRSRIFQKFAQADSSDTRQRGGTGLGLAICQKIIQNFGGSIGFDSMEGEGAVFYFELPFAPTGADRKQEPPRQSRPA